MTQKWETLYQEGMEFYKQGDYNKAANCFKEALGIMEKISGKEPPDYVMLLNFLARVYKGMGEYEKAEPLYHQALDIGEKVLGKEHPDYAGYLHNLAGLYKEMGEYEKAEPLYHQALDIGEKVLGKEHPNYALCLHNLAGLYKEMGEYEKAEPLYHQALYIREKVLGKEHPKYARCLNDLAEVYKYLGEYKKAEPLYHQVLSIREQVLGKGHPDYAASLNDLAGLYELQGQYERADFLYCQAWDIERFWQDEYSVYETNLKKLVVYICAQEVITGKRKVTKHSKSAKISGVLVVREGAKNEDKIATCAKDQILERALDEKQIDEISQRLAFYTKKAQQHPDMEEKEKILTELKLEMIKHVAKNGREKYISINDIKSALLRAESETVSIVLREGTTPITIPTLKVLNYVIGQEEIHKTEDRIMFFSKLAIDACWIQVKIRAQAKLFDMLDEIVGEKFDEAGNPWWKTENPGEFLTNQVLTKQHLTPFDNSNVIFSQMANVFALLEEEQTWSDLSIPEKELTKLELIIKGIQANDEWNKLLEELYTYGYEWNEDIRAFGLAKLAFNEGDFKRAKKILKAIVPEKKEIMEYATPKPYEQDAHYMLGYIAKEEERINDAIRYFEIIDDEKNVNYISAKEWLLDLYYAKNRIAAYWTLKIELIQYYLKNKKYDKAEKYGREAESYNDGTAMASLAEVLIRRGELEGSQEKIKEGLELCRRIKKNSVRLNPNYAKKHPLGIRLKKENLAKAYQLTAEDHLRKGHSFWARWDLYKAKSYS